MTAPEPTQQLEQQNAQRDQARYATVESIRAKKPRVAELKVDLNGDGDEVVFKFQSISRPAYDKLLSEHPPTDEDREKDPSADMNGKTFPPALLARVCKAPKMAEQEWADTWESDDWSLGELGSLFWTANNLCQRSLNLTPFEKG